MALQGNRQARENIRHPDNFLSVIDLELHAFYRERIPPIFGSVLYVSEEADPEVLPGGVNDLPDHVAIVDPLDTSELAVRALHGYTHIVIYSMAGHRPVAAVVGDMFHFVTAYWAYNDERYGDMAFLHTRRGEEHRLCPSTERDLSRALVTNYLMRPRERFTKLASQLGLIKALSAGSGAGRIGVDYGSVGLCHVAAGFTDAMVEFAKGFALWDLYPGQYILRASGGTVRSLSGDELPLDLGFRSVADVNTVMHQRRKFVAAGTVELSEALLKELEPP